MFSQIFFILFAAQQAVSIHVHVKEGHTVAMEVDAKGETVAMAPATGTDVLRNKAKSDANPASEKGGAEAVQFHNTNDQSAKENPLDGGHPNEDSWRKVETQEEKCGGGTILGWWFLFPWSVFRSLGPLLLRLC